jgi:hypothetical protein
VQKLDKFPEVVSASRYAWHEILDGSVYELARGEDFESKPATFISNARAQAKRRGGTARCRAVVRDGREFVLVQYRPKADEHVR